MIGKKVYLTKKIATWYINHQDIFETPSTGIITDPSHDKMMWLCIMLLMDCKIQGKVIRRGNYCWQVDFKTPFGKERSLFNRNDLHLA